MFYVMFDRVDGDYEEYGFSTLDRALEYLEYFRDDDSELYKRIYVTDFHDTKIYEEIRFQKGDNK